MFKWLRWLSALPELIRAYTRLRDDVTGLLADSRVNAALERFRTDPAISPAAPRISAEWRAVEEAVRRIKM